jgi:hypothetical protein
VKLKSVSLRKSILGDESLIPDSENYFLDTRGMKQQGDGENFVIKTFIPNFYSPPDIIKFMGLRRM